MPIQLEIFHPDRIVIAVARGHVTLEDYGGLLAEIVKADVTHYRKIIDSTDAESDAIDLELLLQADELTRGLNSRPRGPLALVVSRARGEMARGFQERSTDRPIGVFSNIHEARVWLRTLPIVE
ncbi:MAG: hypothetical protein J0J01_15740 [Reyranella sp.]|uniref:hypothetical protein n=1 Tax=Reyranella sp. TaxID=1929291 RepID=UPI001AC8473F|nr:hypothetical protein [Reyranella sp.]MBN9088357.1 hypothetical protein [Reyranella sp.]